MVAKKQHYIKLIGARLLKQLKKNMQRELQGLSLEKSLSINKQVSDSDATPNVVLGKLLSLKKLYGASTDAQ